MTSGSGGSLRSNVVPRVLGAIGMDSGRGAKNARHVHIHPHTHILYAFIRYFFCITAHCGYIAVDGD